MAKTLGVHRRRSIYLLALPAAAGIALVNVGAFVGAGNAFAVLGAGLVLLTIGLYFAMRYRVVIGERSVRIFGPRSVNLGTPRKLRCGQFEQAVIARSVASAVIAGSVEVPMTHAWIAVEGEGGQQVVFRATRGLAQRALGPGWPAGRPPATEHEFYGNVVKLRDAIGEAIR